MSVEPQFKTSEANSLRQEQAHRLQERLHRELGDIIRPLLVDPTVIEIMLNPDGRLWVERLGHEMEPIGHMEASQAESLLNVVASTLNTAITPESPILECELPLDGSRFAAMIPPLTAKPTFSIRRKASHIFTLDEYVAVAMMTPAQRTVIAEAVKHRKNIVVAGGTGSGKTTLINGIIDEIVQQTPQHRLLILEDTLELQCKADNAVIMRTSDAISMQRLVKATLRHRPDRILVGEVRGKEALDLLKAWNTGHPGGVASIHANSTAASLIRLEQLVEEATQAPMRALIAQSVDLIVFIAKTATSRQIQEILAVHGHDGMQYITETLE